MVKFDFNDVINLKNLIEINKEMKKVFNGSNYMIFKENEESNYFVVSNFSERFIHGFIKDDILTNNNDDDIIMSINTEVFYSTFNRPKKNWGKVITNGKRVSVDDVVILSLNPDYKSSVPSYNYDEFLKQNFITINTEDLMDNKKIHTEINGVEFSIAKGLIQGLKKSHKVYIALAPVDIRKKLYDLYIIVDRDLITTVNKYRVVDTK